MKRMRCLMLVNESGFRGGGAEKRIILLLKELLKRKFFSKIVVLHSSKTAHDDFKKAGFYGSGNHVELIGYPGYSGKAYNKTLEAIRQHKPNVIQMHNVNNSGVIKAISDSDVPSVFVAHDYWPLCGKRHFIDACKAESKNLCTEADFLKCVMCSGLRNYMRLKTIRKMLNKFDIGVSPTQMTKKIYEKHGVLNGKWRIISPWIDINIFRKKGKPVKRNNDVLFVGSLADYKGAWVIARAFLSILKSVPDARLVFIGQRQDGMFRKKIEDIAKRGGFLEKVLFLGPKSWNEISKYHKKSGVYVCPPVWPELFGLNWAEALASGCPVVASRTGGIPELLDWHGLLVKPGDPEELANAVIKVLKDKKLAGKMGVKGNHMALKKFNVKRASDEFLSLYRSLSAT